MPDNVRFYFDPRCPWCYQTSRWVRRLEELGELTVTWAVFSLTIANQGDEGRAASTRDGAPALRTAVALRDAHGNAAVGRFYAALGAAIHERGESADDNAVIDAALLEAGADSSIRARALDDPATWTEVQREHDEAVRTHKAFGVPTIVLDSGAGPAIFGPVIIEVPGDNEAVELWRHVSWLVRNQNFAELKRERSALPDLESIRRALRRKAEREARAA
jgi:predicted DsbA family dithiol-disulfide isomerase